MSEACFSNQVQARVVTRQIVLRRRLCVNDGRRGSMSYDFPVLVGQTCHMLPKGAGILGLVVTSNS